MSLMILGLLILIGYQVLYNTEIIRHALVARFGFASFAISSGVTVLIALALVMHGKSTVAYSTVWILPAIECGTPN